MFLYIHELSIWQLEILKFISCFLEQKYEVTWLFFQFDAD